MKNKLVVALGILVVVLLSVVSVRSYDTWKVRHDAKVAGQQQSAVDAVKTELSLEKAKYSESVSERKDMYDQCLVGVASWDKLAPAVQKTQPKPDCDLSFR